MGLSRRRYASSNCKIFTQVDKYKPLCSKSEKSGACLHWVCIIPLLTLDLLTKVIIVKSGQNNNQAAFLVPMQETADSECAEGDRGTLAG